MAQLFFKYGAMNSGKSIEILKVAHNYEEQNKPVVLMTSGLDTRAGVGQVASRIGIEKNALPIFNETNLFDVVAGLPYKPYCVLIDEAQFLTKQQVYVLSDIVDNQNIPVLCYGLKTDFRGNLFEGSKTLLEIADNIEEIKTVCQFCPRKAIMNLRVKRVEDKCVPVFTGEIIEIGDEEYIQTCRKCYRDIIKKNEV